MLFLIEVIMIKEIKPIKANTKTGFAFGSIEIVSEIISPIEKKLSVDQETIYFKELFDSLGTIKVKKRKEFKDADMVPIYLWSQFFCFSAKFKHLFEDKLKGYWYPTSNSNYFIFLLDNEIKAFDLEKTTIVYDIDFPEKPYQYNYILNEVFKPEVEKEYLFTIIELYGMRLVNSEFEKIINQNQLTGIQFYKDLNIKREHGKRFDPFRRKKYDVDGNCLS
jgi:hypothetical protein